MKFRTTLVMSVFVSLLFSTALFAQCSMHGMTQDKATKADPAQSASAAPEAKTAGVLSTYPLDYCIISGEKLGAMGDPVIKTYDGREVRFCCNMCPKTFEKDKAKYFKKLDDAIVAKEKPGYPLQTCPVTGEKLGKMGDPVDYVYGNHLVRLCCNGCVAKIKQEPAKYLNIVGDAYAAAGTPATAPSAAPATKDPQQNP